MVPLAFCWFIPSLGCTPWTFPVGASLQPLSSGWASHVTEGPSLDPRGLSLLPAPCRGRRRCERRPGAHSLAFFREAGTHKVVQ